MYNIIIVDLCIILNVLWSHAVMGWSLYNTVGFDIMWVLIRGMGAQCHWGKGESKNKCLEGGETWAGGHTLFMKP